MKLQLALSYSRAPSRWVRLLLFFPGNPPNFCRIHGLHPGGFAYCYSPPGTPHRDPDLSHFLRPPFLQPPFSSPSTPASCSRTPGKHHCSVRDPPSTQIHHQIASRFVPWNRRPSLWEAFLPRGNDDSPARYRACLRMCLYAFTCLWFCSQRGGQALEGCGGRGTQTPSGSV